MQIVVNIPDQYLLDTNAVEIEQRLKLSTALLMFQAGQISAGGACDFAGVDRYTFMEACKRHSIDVISYDEEALESEFDQLKKTADSC